MTDWYSHLPNLLACSVGCGDGGSVGGSSSKFNTPRAPRHPIAVPASAGIGARMAAMTVSVADMAAAGRGSVAPWESVRNSWDSAGSGPGSRGKKRYDVR